MLVKPCIVENKLGSCIAIFHNVDPFSLRRLVHDVLAIYELKSTCIVKSFVLRICLVLHQLVISYLSSQSVIL